MAFPIGWGRKHKITIDNTVVSGSGSHTDFPALITLDMLDTEAVDAGSNSALNGGGDIRFSSDSSGATQLPCEVVNFVTSATPASRACEIHVKIPSVSTSTDTDIYIWYNKSGETQPAVADTYGRNAVWSDYAAVLHLNEASGPWVDSTGNGHDATLTTGSAIASVTTGHPWGGTWLDFTTAVALTLSSSASMLDASDITLSVWGNFDYVSNARGLLGNRWDSPNNNWAQMMSGGRMFVKEAGAEDIVTPTTLSTSTNYLQHLVWDRAAGLKSYSNGANIGTDNSLVNVTGITGATDFRIGTYHSNSSSYRMDGRAGEVRATTKVLSADWITTEYNNQSDPATFATAGTPTDGGVGDPLAVGATSSSEAAVLTSLVGGGSARTTEAAALVSFTPPSTQYTRASQAMGLVSSVAGAIPACSQSVVLVAYRTGSIENLNNRAWTFALDGHTFYVLTLGEQGTFVFDESTGEWCQWQTEGLSGWNMEIGTTWRGKVIAADQSEPLIYELTPDSFLDDGFKTQTRVVTGGLSMRQRAFVANYAFRITASMGSPDTAPTLPATPPTINLSYSDDQGKTFQDAGDVEINPQEYTQIVQWLSLGTMRAPQRVFKITDTGAIARLDGADAEVGEEGA